MAALLVLFASPTTTRPVQVGSVEIERICVRHVPAIDQAAAVALTPAGGGPDELHIFLVPVSFLGGRGQGQDATGMQRACQQALREHLNPLFKVQGITLCSSLPRNASNKVLRRVLRDQLRAEVAQRPRL
jgi:acyl-coenzyme A synthetase/AMP-(fatty) acid ligase